MKTEAGKLHDEILIQLATDPKMQSLKPLPMLQTVTRVLAKTLDADRVSLWQIDPLNQVLVPLDEYEKKSKEHREAESVEMRKITKLLGEIRSNRHLDIFQFSEDERVKELREGLWNTKDVKSLLLIPVFGSGTVEGVLRVDHLGSRRIWIEDEVRFACQAADLIGLSLKNFELQRREKELEYVLAFTQEFDGSLETEKVRDHFLECTASVLQADSAMIFKCDQRQQQLRLLSALNPPKGYEGSHLKYREGAAGLAADQGKSLAVSDYENFPQREKVFEADKPFAHVLAEPILQDDAVIAVIQVMRKDPKKRFDKHDQMLMQQMCCWYSLAVEQQRIRDRVILLKEYRQTLSRMVEVGQYASGIPDLLNTALDYCESMLGTGLEIIKVDRWSVVRGLSQDFHQQIQQIMKSADYWTTAPITVDSIHNTDRLHPLVTEALKQTEIQAFMFIPLMIEDQNGGYFLVASPYPYEWQEDEVALLEFTAKYVALETRRIQTDLENQARTNFSRRINFLGKKLSHVLTYAEAVSVVGNTSVDLMNPDQAFLLMRNPKNELAVEYTYEIPGWLKENIFADKKEHIEAFFLSVKYPKLVTVAKEDQIPKKLKDYLEEEAISSLKLLPLIYQDQTVGVLAALFKHEQDWPDYERDMLLIFSKTAILSLQNAWTLDELEKGYLDVAMTLANAMDARETTIDDMTIRIANWAEATARKLGCSEEDLRNIRLAAILHDIGKSEVPETVLRKPGPLTAEEWTLVQGAPKRGEEMIQPLSRHKEVASIIRSIHERYDGQGYPDQIKGHSIPLLSRILAVAVAYASMIDERTYRKALSWQEAVTELRENKGTQFDPRVVDKFITVVQPKMADV